MASLTGNLVAETYKALLKTIDNDILTASEKQITDGFGGGSNVFIDSNGFLRANKYKVTNGLATQFLKADGSLDANTYLTSITSSQIIAALGFTPVTNARTLTINGTTYDLSANRSWTVAGTAAVWGNITGTLSNQTDLQNALNAKFNNPTGTISQYIRGDGSIATFPTLPGGLPIGGTTGQILAKINATDYNTEWIDNFATQTKNEVKLGQTLTKGTAVYVSSANGTNIIVSAASNVSEALSSKTFGLLETGGATNAFVKCVTFGLLAGLDTSTATAGDPVWLGVNGALIFGLANKPFAPAHLVYIGVVTRVQSNNGEIFVNVQNGFELKELHDVAVQTPSNNDGLFFETATSLWKNKSIATVLGYTPQAQLSGTGFVKASGTTISYDNSIYLTTTDAASTYQRLDKMVSNLLASATEYPNSNAVIAALALKADAANPVFTGNMTISGAEPKLTFTDTDQNPDYFIGVDAGFFRIYDQTAGLTRFVINSSGVTTIAGDLIVGTIAKTGGTASQFLKADGTIDSSTYVTSATLANYLLSATAATTYQTLANLSTDLTASATKYPSVNAVVTGLGTKQPLDADLTAIAALVGTAGFLIKTAADTWSLDTNTYLTTTSAASTYLTQTTAASTYQRLDKMVSNLLASSTEYPNSNAVLAKLALKADAANPVFTGDLTISGATPRLYFVDTDQNPDYTIFVDSGYFYIYDQTAGATKFQITPSGNAINTGTLTSTSFIKSGGTASQFLKADGSVDSNAYALVSALSNYLPLNGNWGGSTGMNDYKLYLRTNGDNNHYLWNAADDWEELNAYEGTGLRITSNMGSTGLLYVYGSTSGGYTYSPYSFRSPIFYDSNNTAYFGDFASTSSMYGISIRTDIAGSGDTGSQVFLYGSGNTTTSSIGFKNGTMFASPTGYGDGWNTLFTMDTPGRGWVFREGIGGTNFNAAFTSGWILNNGVWQANTRMNAPIFYDSADSSYYLDPNANSRIARLSLVADWNGSGALNIRGNYPSITFRNPVSDSMWLRHMDGGGDIQHYFAAGVDSSSWTIKHTMSTNGNFSSSGTHTASQFNGSGAGLTGVAASLTAGNTTSISSAVNTGYTWYGIQYFLTNNGTSAVNNSNSAALQAYSTGNNSAFMSFHRAGYYAVNMGLDSDNVFRIGGWSAGANRLQLNLDSGTMTIVASMTATSFFESSDIRLKTLIDCNPQIAGIENLQAKLYEKDGKIELGYFAQDAEKLMPYAVTKGTDGFLNLSYREVHTAKIARLEQRVAELEKQLNAA